MEFMGILLVIWLAISYIKFLLISENESRDKRLLKINKVIVWRCDGNVLWDSISLERGGCYFYESGKRSRQLVCGVWGIYQRAIKEPARSQGADMLNEWVRWNPQWATRHSGKRARVTQIQILITTQQAGYQPS